MNCTVLKNQPGSAPAVEILSTVFERVDCVKILYYVLKAVMLFCSLMMSIATVFVVSSIYLFVKLQQYNMVLAFSALLVFFLFLSYRAVKETMEFTVESLKWEKENREL